MQEHAPHIGNIGETLSRHQLAERMLHAFECGASNAFTIRAPAKSSTSEFLHMNLMPVAGERGFRTGHVSFDMAGSSPEALVCQCIAEMIGEQPPAGVVGLDSLREQFKKLISNGDRFLLCLGDVDELANRPEPQSFLYALRTMLEQNRQQIVVVFTGSDQERLRSIFSDARAPFYKSSLFVDVP